MDHKYVLNYFPLPGRGEPARILFHIAGVKFTDNQIAFADWSQQKNDAKRFPLGQLPTLEVDGKVAMCQSLAIYRFLADEFGLHGTSNLDKALIAQVTESLSEIQEGWVSIKFDGKTSDEEKKVALIKYYGGDFVKQRMEFIEGKLRNSCGKFLLGDKTSLADVLCFCNHDYAMNCNPSAMEHFPKLNELFKTISEMEPIKKYLLSRKYEAKLF